MLPPRSPSVKTHAGSPGPIVPDPDFGTNEAVEGFGCAPDNAKVERFDSDTNIRQAQNADDLAVVILDDRRGRAFPR